ncbi:MAG: hypothetical protein WD274_10050 [Acidimicrobiia bacterium]
MKRIALAVLLGSIVVSCSSEPTSSTPDVSTMEASKKGELTVQAIRLACGDTCSVTPMYVRDQLLDIESLDHAEPIPVEMKEAIADAFPDATFVDFDEVEAIIAEVDAGEAVLVNLAPVTELAPGVAGVDIAVISTSVHGQTIQFTWDGSSWVVTESGDTGVTVTSFVS